MIIIKVPASLLPLEVLAVELHPSAETATKRGRAHKSQAARQLESPRNWVGEPHYRHHHHRCHHHCNQVTMYTRSCKEDSPAKPTTRPTQQQSSRRPITSSGEQTGGGPPLPQKVSHHILLELSPNTQYIYDDDTGNDDDDIGIKYDWSGWRKARRALSVFLCTRGKL